MHFRSVWSPGDRARPLPEPTADPQIQYIENVARMDRGFSAVGRSWRPSRTVQGAFQIAPLQLFRDVLLSVERQVSVIDLEREDRKAGRVEPSALVGAVAAVGGPAPGGIPFARLA